MEKPDKIKNRFEKKITITLQSFNFEELIRVQEKLMREIKVYAEEQEYEEKQNYVWINTMMETKCKSKK